MNNIVYEKEADEKEYFYYHLSNNNVCTPHFHNNLEMIIMTKGQQRITINSNESILNVGDIAISNCFDVHYYNTIGISQMHIFVLGEEYCRRFYMFYGKVFQNFLEFKEEAFNELQKICQLLDNNSMRTFSPLMKYGIVDMVLGVLIKYYPLINRRKNNPSEIVSILTYIEQNSKLDLSLDTLSLKFGYAKNYFSNLFNKYTGMHIRDYINMIRIGKAKALYEKSESSMTDIAMSCGFDSMNTFYRAWNKYK